MKHKLTLIVCAAFVSSAAIAADTFTQLDSDKDGALTRAEARILPNLTQKWDTADANRDGTVDKAEFSKFEAKPSEPEAKPSKSEAKPSESEMQSSDSEAAQDN